MNPQSQIISTLALLSVLLGGCATQPSRSFPEAATLPAQTELPDPLVMLDGQRVTSRAEWFK